MSNRTKRYLVTGGAGFIGSHLVDALIERGYDIVVLDNLATGSMENVNSGAIFVSGDIRTYDFSSLGEFDGIFHLAALARIYPSIVDPVTTDSVNVHGTLRVFDFARKIKAKVVFSSSSSIYGTQEVLPSKEDATPDIRSPYSLQKMICEKYLDLFHGLYNLQYAALRYFNVYGERQLMSGGSATVIGIFLRQYSNGEPFTIIGDGKRRRDFTYVRDTVEGTIKAMEHSLPALICNIGRGMSYSIEEIAGMISQAHPIRYLPMRPGEYHETRADTRRARELLHWEPTMCIQDWIQAHLPTRPVALLEQ